MPWFEVESKIKIVDYEEVLESIRRIAVFSGREVKDDDYFALHVNGYPKKAFRIRTENGKFIVNFKKWSKNLWSDGVVVKEEFEFILHNKPDLEVFLALMKDLGFKRWVHKKKISETYSYNRNKRLHLEINNVGRLGYWLEMEYLCKDLRSIPAVKRLIRDVISRIDGLGRIDNTGYTKMLYKKK